VLQRQPRRVSIPKCAWKQAATIMQTWRLDETRNIKWRKSVPLVATFGKHDLDSYVNLCPKRVAPEQLLARGEGQTVSCMELHDLLLFMKLECSYMIGGPASSQKVSTGSISSVFVWDFLKFFIVSKLAKQVMEQAL
jgi:hypothetical protein